MNNTTVAQTILQQLGGNKFIAMTGTKNFLSDGNKLHMKLVTNISKSNYLTIELNELSDTYKMRFFKQSGGTMNKKTFEFSPIKEKDIEILEDIYADQLQKTFTEITGLDTHL